jgi:hypothetical protein
MFKSISVALLLSVAACQPAAAQPCSDRDAITGAIVGAVVGTGLMAWGYTRALGKMPVAGPGALPGATVNSHFGGVWFGSLPAKAKAIDAAVIAAASTLFGSAIGAPVGAVVNCAKGRFIDNNDLTWGDVGSMFRWKSQPEQPVIQHEL